MPAKIRDDPLRISLSPNQQLPSGGLSSLISREETRPLTPIREENRGPYPHQGARAVSAAKTAQQTSPAESDDRHDRTVQSDADLESS